MTLDELLNTDSQHTTIPPREEHVQATIAAASASFVRAESEMPMATHTFLRIQLALIHKRWWLAQALLLVLVALALPGLAEIELMARGLGVTAALFVILVIPEFARNSSANAMEIEGTTHYTLRHIYAARLVLFGGVDLVILTGFCGALTLALQLSLATLVTQFLLPLVTTACLCFAVLSSPRAAQGNGGDLRLSLLEWRVVAHRRKRRSLQPDRAAALVRALCAEPARAGDLRAPLSQTCYRTMGGTTTWNSV